MRFSCLVGRPVSVFKVAALKYRQLRKVESSEPAIRHEGKERHPLYGLGEGVKRGQSEPLFLKMLIKAECICQGPVMEETPACLRRQGAAVPRGSYV